MCEAPPNCLGVHSPIQICLASLESHHHWIFHQKLLISYSLNYFWALGVPPFHRVQLSLARWILEPWTFQISRPACCWRQVWHIFWLNCWYYRQSQFLPRVTALLLLRRCRPRHAHERRHPAHGRLWYPLVTCRYSCEFHVLYLEAVHLLLKNLYH